MKNFKALLNLPKAEVKADGDNVLSIYGAIGDFWDECDAKSVVDRISSMKGDITLKLNSPGGDVFDGITIMNALKAHEGKVTVIIEGLAASAASYLAIGAADELRMAEGAMLMIHNAWTFACGNSEDLRKQADLLDKLSENIASIYVNHSNKSLDEVKAAMDAETWFTASEARDFGFNIITDEHEARLENFEMLSVFNRVPESYRASVRACRPSTKRELEASLRTLGYSRNEAKAIASKAYAQDNQCDAETPDNSEMLLASLDKAISERKSIFQ